MSAIRLSGASKRYRDGDARIEALAPLDLDLPRAMLFAMRGPSGSGKTTLLGLMGGMIAPTRGTVALLGEDITHLRDHHRARVRREKVGFVSQALSLIEGMSVLENVLLPLVPLGGARPEHRARAATLLARFEMGDRARSDAARLSGGQRQRVALARALILDPPIVLLDEPTAHLDADHTRALLALLAGLRDEGRTIVAATHDPRLAEDARVDRVLEMSDGRVLDGE